nr:site-specific integrase [Polycyclovorans algicola]
MASGILGAVQTAVKRLKVKKTDIEPFSLEEVRRLVDEVRADFQDYLIARFFTGMRSGEIHGLKWRFVDFDRREIRVRETIVNGREEYTKTDGSQREIQMSQPVFDALQRMQVRTGNGVYVFQTSNGLPIDTHNFTNRIWNPLLDRLGLKRRRPYQTRHTAATLWLAAGENPEWIARQMGHTSTQMLFSVYSRYIANLTRQDGSAFDRLIRGAMPTGGTSNED